MSLLTCTLHHNIGLESAFEKGLNVTSDPELFARQIAWFAKNYDIIDLDTMMSGKLPGKPLLITFDDVFQSIADAIRDVLKPLGLPSVVFINPGLLEPGSISLDSTLAWAASQIGLDRLCKLLDLPPRAAVGAIVVGDMARFGAAERDEIKTRIFSELGPPDLAPRAPLMQKDTLRDLASMNVEIGNHSATHVHMRALNAQERYKQIVKAKATLEALSGQTVRSFSVPYGNEADLTPDTLADIRAAGHQATFLVHARSNHRRPAPDVWYRTSLRNEPPHALKRHIVYKPLLRTIRNWV